jgi:hypothetical protein
MPFSTMGDGVGGEAFGVEGARAGGAGAQGILGDREGVGQDLRVHQVAGPGGAAGDGAAVDRHEEVADEAELAMRSSKITG